jgi:pimeloyl-ACP methyl ester carboxylesterase
LCAEFNGRSGGRSEGIEGAGHWLQESHPQVVNEAIRGFVPERVHHRHGSTGR